MSKVIINMRMPSRCGECPIAQNTKSGLRCPISSKQYGYSCNVSHGLIGRPGHCPIDDEPVKQGHWNFDDFDGDGFDYTCSNCNLVSKNEYDYCPHCGAKMDEVRE